VEDRPVAVPDDLFAEQPELSGDGLRLVQLGPATDADAYAALLDDPEGRALTGTHARFSREQVDRWLVTRPEQADRADWAVLDPRTGALLGEAVLNDLDADNEAVGYRVALVPGARGRGLGTEVTRLVTACAFAMGLHRVELQVYAHNPRAQRAYEKAGFRVEGRLRDVLLQDGRRIDAVVMAALATEWSGG
jgi:RimJ/RimL family protein N-acetyltransferase